MLDLDPQLTAAFAVGSCVAVLLLLAVVLVLARRVRVLSRHHARAIAAERTEDVLDVLARHEDLLARLQNGVLDLDARTGELRSMAAETTSRIGIVRYDAFADMGGALSFSAALLDEHGDGIVISAINGRTETRCYAKAVRGGLPSAGHDLSFEEEAAIGRAIDGERDVVISPEPGRRGRRRAR